MAMTGRSLGHYRLDERVGAGGMGVVYKARDTRLHRTVAIKVLSGDATGAEARTRTLHEARAASGLNHPHICTVHEVGEADGQAFIVMEFVDGRPLETIVAPAGLTSDLVCRYGMQIASALEHAHERGVVHRDLKSANVIVTSEGRVKVLDFGLATRALRDAGDTETRSGQSIESDSGMAGTLAYLAPEILLGKPAGPQTDIWALGVVLYEMAAGRQPFHGQNRFDITASILRSPATPLPSGVSPGLGAVISRCLAKDPADRYRHASEVHAALEAIQSSSSMAPAYVPPARAWRPARIALWLVVAGVAGAGLWLAYGVTGPRDSAPVGGGRTTLLLASQTPVRDPALSPDGKMLVYVLEDGSGRSDLFVTRVAGGDRIRLTDDEAREEAPTFSPDGERIAFGRRAPNQDAEIAIVPTFGGDLITVLRRAAQPTWSPDGRTLAFVYRADDENVRSLGMASVDGSNVKPLLRADSAFPFLREPAWSPDGRLVAIVRGSGGVAGEIVLVPVDGGAPERLGADPPSVFSQRPVFTSDGRGIVYSSNLGGATNIWVRPVAGDASPVRLTTGPGPDEWVSVATDGTIAFLNSKWRNVLLLGDLQTNSTQVLTSHSPFIWAPSFSPDGRQIAFSRGDNDGAWHIWTIDASGGEPRRVTFGPAGEIYPRYTPDGGSIVYHNWSAPMRIWRASLAGGPPVPITPDGGPDELLADVSPHGDLVAYASADPDGDRVYVARLDGTGARRLVDAPGSVPRWSPDGRWIAFGGERGYAGGIFIAAADGTGLRRLTREGGWPVWWPDGRRIAYQIAVSAGSQRILVVSIDDNTTAEIALVRFAGSNFPFDIARDGRSFVTSNSTHVSDEIWLLGRK